MESDVLRCVARHWPDVDEVIPDRDQQQWYRRIDPAKAHRDPPAAADQRGQPAECAVHNLLRQTHPQTHGVGIQKREREARPARTRVVARHPLILASHAPWAGRTSCSPSRSPRGASPSFRAPAEVFFKKARLVITTLPPRRPPLQEPESLSRGITRMTLTPALMSLE